VSGQLSGTPAALVAQLGDGGDTGLWSSKFDIPDNLEFLQPGRLWWLVAVGALLAAYVVLQFVRRGAAVRFTNVRLLDKIAPQRPNWRRHLAALFLLLGLAGMILAYAEPAAATEVPSERATIMLAIDTSLSMQAEDVEPSRIDGAKEAATTFLEEVPEQINVGLVSFNGIATVRVPPSTNRAAVRSAILDLELGEATAIGEAIFASIDSLEAFITEFEGDAPPARIVLMSDGETTVGRPDAAAVDRARLAGISVSTIAFGTDGGPRQRECARRDRRRHRRRVLRGCDHRRVDGDLHRHRLGGGDGGGPGQRQQLVRRPRHAPDPDRRRALVVLLEPSAVSSVR